MEIWKSIEGYENYEVSNFGNVKSLCRVVERKKYNYYIKEKMLKPNKDKQGYERVFLTNIKGKTLRVHRLVALNFIINYKNKKEVNHINGIKTDNRVENLEWCTGLENMQHAYNNNLVPLMKGEKNGRSKLTEIQISEIRNSSDTVKKLSYIYNVSTSLLYQIRLNKAWKHI